jgi:hypothetical protein
MTRVPSSYSPISTPSPYMKNLRTRALYCIQKPKPKNPKKWKPENPDPRTMLLTGIIVATEDRHPVVQEKQNEDQKECHPNRRPTDPMDGIGLTG